MPRRWTIDEAEVRRTELVELYVSQNKTIGDIALLLGMSETGVYDRLQRLSIPSLRVDKPHFNNRRTDVVIPREYSEDLAEFVGILLGDGHLTPTQVTVTLGTKDRYAPEVAQLMERIFHIVPRIIVRKEGEHVVYFGSTVVVRWLLAMGLCFNKVCAQVDVPRWIFTDSVFMRSALRGLFDTDGSVYRLAYGVQISFCNHSRPLLNSVHQMLATLGFHPSAISGANLYLTRRADLGIFFQTVGFRNRKHQERFKQFTYERYGWVV